jgi:hypothetical protein
MWGVKCGERVWVGGLLAHKLCLSGLRFNWSASSSGLLVGIFPAARTPIRPRNCGTI